MASPSAASSLVRLKDGKESFLRLCEGLNETSLQEPLGPDEWSFAQTLDHLVKAEKGFIMGIMRASKPLPPRSAEQDDIRERVTKGLLSGAKYPVPVPSVEPVDEPDFGSLLAEWDKFRGRLDGMAESGKIPAPDILVAEHPIAGPLNADESLQFLADHLTYHLIRVKELLEARR